MNACDDRQNRSADWQSAVSRIGNPQPPVSGSKRNGEAKSWRKPAAVAEDGPG